MNEVRGVREVRGVLALLAVLGILGTAANAQTPEPAPRWPDGHVNLGSTAAQKGYWEVRPGLGGFPRTADVPLQPWARALAQFRNSKNDLYPPSVRCKPSGGPGFFNAPGFEIVEVPDERKIYILGIAGAHSWRVIYMDGRPHPPAERLRPTYLGHSIGRWDGDTLVVDSVGFNEKQWLGSYPSTGPVSFRSSALPCGSPSTMSTRTTSA
jgi:hypothetical protein